MKTKHLYSENVHFYKKKFVSYRYKNSKKLKNIQFVHIYLKSMVK